MSEKHFVIGYYKNADSGIHIQKIENSEAASEPHSHEYYQIYYIVRGTLTHVTESDTSVLCAGDAFIIPPGRTHYIRNVGDSLFYTFSFTMESIAESLSDISLAAGFLRDIQKESRVRASLKLRDDELLFTENLLEIMYSEFTEKRIGYGDVLSAYTKILLTLLARRYYDKDYPSIDVSDNRSRILYCIKYIDENFTEKLSLSDAAKWCAMSKTTFCKQFREISGVTFKCYLNQARIKYAVSFIDKGYKISGIYGLCGYNDFSTFYRNFKNIMGCAPEKYRMSTKNAYKAK